jgi:hypothetical protein
MKWDLDQPWCIGIEDYKTLTNYIDSSSFSLILELGSGLSTFQLAEDFPHIRILSLENDYKIREKNNQILQSNGKDYAQILFAPIKKSICQGAIFETYDFKTLKHNSQIDLLIVDGPVEKKFPLGREASLYFLFDKLAIGAVIGLDDYHRSSAKATVNNWLTTFGNSIAIEEETSSFIVLRKKSECLRYPLNLGLAWRSHKLMVPKIIRKVRSSIHSKLINSIPKNKNSKSK